MKKFSNIVFGLFVIAVLAGINSCSNDDDDNGNLTTKELLIGTWTVSDFELNIKVGAQNPNLLGFSLVHSYS